MSVIPLHITIKQGDEASVAALLKAGADPDVRSKFDHAPRELAERAGLPVRRLFKKPKAIADFVAGARPDAARDPDRVEEQLTAPERRIKGKARRASPARGSVK